LQKIYARLNEPDAVHGIMATREREPSLEELIIAHEVTGQLQVLYIYVNDLLEFGGGFYNIYGAVVSFTCSVKWYVLF
jgi:hypothetical protein